MINKYEEYDSNKENSFSIENLDFRTANHRLQKINDSFNSSSFIRNNSDTSLISISYQDDLKFPPKPAKSFKPSRQAVRLTRPLSVLKTTFLDDTITTIFPKRLTPDLPERPEKTQKVLQKKPSFSSIMESKILPEADERLTEFESIILKKDALIEILRTRVSKLVDEIEETHLKLNSAKANTQDELRFKDLQQKYEDSEQSVQEYYAKVKELNFCLDKKDEEISILSKELKTQRLELDAKSEYIRKIETELNFAQGNREDIEKVIESLKAKFDNSMKAIEISSSHKNHLEQEVIRLEIIKRNHENEINVVIEEHAKSLAGLKKKLEDSCEEASRYQRLFKESKASNEVLQKTNFSLIQKLQNLEEQLCRIDESIRAPLNEQYERFNLPVQVSFKEKGKERSCERCEKKKESSPQKSLKEIMDFLGVTNCFEVVPCLKKTVLTKKEKKLVKKIMLLVKQCLNKDTGEELGCGQVWRIIKRVFEDYAKIVKEIQVNEVKVVREMLGNGNLVDKINFILQENLIMKEVVTIVKRKLRLSATASFSEIELAVNSLSVMS